MVEENQVNASKFNFPDEKNVFLKTLLETTGSLFCHASTTTSQNQQTNLGVDKGKHYKW